MRPLAYTASTVLQDKKKLALFGGITQDLSTGEYRVVDEILFLDLETLKW